MSFHGRPLRINTVSDSILYSFVFYLTELDKTIVFVFGKMLTKCHFPSAEILQVFKCSK